ncbi:MAG: AAA family ATPase [Oscillospiraceae bacterium]|nr:AAA family ATPase [Oscillospiraceae bacterium]
MKRKISEFLLQWKDSGSLRVPLLLHGARHVGKTYALKKFGKEHYASTVYLNFEENPALIELFEDSIEPKKLIAKIESFFNVRVSPAGTLIIFDELQCCSRALTSLKYFCDNAPEYNLICASSLFGIHTSKTDHSFPVGKVTTKAMFPLDFEEFLWASDKAVFTDAVKESFSSGAPISKILHEGLMHLFREYLLVGGMPLVVSSYLNSDSSLTVRDAQKLIVDSFISDISKYAEKALCTRTIDAFNSVSLQLAKPNKKFQYRLITKGARASLYSESIDFLSRTGIVLRCDKSDAQDFSSEVVNAELSSFKLYLCDVGLMSFLSNLTAETWRIFDASHLDGIFENYVANALAANEHELLYWESESKAKTQFLVRHGGKTIPLEVKAGDNTRSYSLSSYLKKFNPEYGIRISGRNFGFGNGVKSVPLYAAYLV